MGQWYLFEGDKEHGPIDDAELKRLAVEGKITPTDMVRRNDMSEWVSASRVRGLFSLDKTRARQEPVPLSTQVPSPDRVLMSIAHQAQPRRTGKLLISILIVSGCALLVIPFVWVFLLSGTWENDNALEVTRMAGDVVACCREGDREAAVLKYKELTDFIGDHKLTQPNTMSAVSQANRKVNEEKNLRAILGIETTANNHIAKNEPEKAVVVFQKAIEHIRTAQTDNPAFAEAATRIAKSKMAASGQLDELRRANEDADRLAAETRELARIQGTITGGAWLTKKAGNSEILRGLSVLLLKAAGTHEQYLTSLHLALPQLQEELKEDMKTLDSYLDKAKQDPFYSSRVDSHRVIIKIREERIALVRKELDDATKMAATRPIDLAAIHRRISPFYESSATYTAWSMICIQQVALSTHTDVEGKYEITAPGGHYYLYARFETSLSTVEWFIPVTISTPGTTKIDLHNDSAYAIINKDTD